MRRIICSAGIWELVKELGRGTRGSPREGVAEMVDLSRLSLVRHRRAGQFRGTSVVPREEGMAPSLCPFGMHFNARFPR